LGIAGVLYPEDLERDEKRFSKILEPLIRMMAPAVARLRDLHIQEFEANPRLEPDIPRFPKRTSIGSGER
jgi:hypothetical protein